MVQDSKLDVCRLFWEVAAVGERQRQSCVSLHAAGHLPWPLWQPLHRLNEKCYKMVSSASHKDLLGKGPAIRKKPSKAANHLPLRSGSESLRCWAQLYQRSWHLQQPCWCLICFSSEKETSQQLHCGTQMLQTGSGWVRVAFNHELPFLPAISVWGSLQPAAEKTAQDVPCVASQVTPCSYSCSCEKWPGDRSSPLDHEAWEGFVLGQSTWTRDAGSLSCASFPWFSTALCSLSFISSLWICFY